MTPGIGLFRALAVGHIAIGVLLLPLALDSKPHEDAGMSAERFDVGIMIRPVQAVVRQVEQAQIEHDARATTEAVSHATTSLQ